MMIERLLFEAVRRGVDAVLADPSLIVDFFRNKALLSLDEATKIADTFVKQPPGIIHGYARSDSKFPLYAITLSNDGGGQSFIGDSGGIGADREDIYARIRQYQFTIMVYAQHPDVTLYYFHLLQEFLVASIDTLKSEGGLFDVTFGGADMAPDPQYAPAGLFLRRCSFSCSREYTQTLLGSKLGRAWKVSGIHVDSSGAPEHDIGGVETNVKTFVEGVDDGEE
jgi:hypothetical protein